jgi:outer membrane protein TolC
MQTSTSDRNRPARRAAAPARRAVAIAAIAAVAWWAPALRAQQPGRAAPAAARPLSLDEALRMAERASEDVGIARAGVRRARGEQYRARSELFPQLTGSASYTRALRSEFEGLDVGGPPDTRPPCRAFIPQGGLTTDQRLDSLEQALALATDCAPGGSGIDFGNLPFGRANTWRLNLNASQTLFSGGRILAQTRVAGAGRRTAEIGLASAHAQVVLDVVQAYYDAVLGERLYDIARLTLQQAETTLTQTRLARQVGTQPEFELLRAQVTRDNQIPVVLQRRTERDLAQLRLKQILEIPLDQPLVLTTGLADSAEVTPPARLTSLADAASDTSTDGRAPVRQAEEAVRAQEGLLRVARSQRFPTISVFSQYGRVGYPIGGVPGWDEFRENWNVGVNLSVPLFAGGRIRGDELVAEANLTEQRLRFQQVRELTELDTRNALAQLERAEASWRASVGTVEQASRAYTIAEVRWREGISTQTELNDSRILLQQAQANRALAARDLQVARARVALLRDLPITTIAVPGAQGSGGSGGSGGAGSQQQTPSQQPPRQQPQPAQTADFTQTGQP